jgi:hypothetical protein
VTGRRQCGARWRTFASPSAIVTPPLTATETCSAWGQAPRWVDRSSPVGNGSPSAMAAVTYIALCPPAASTWAVIGVAVSITPKCPTSDSPLESAGLPAHGRFFGRCLVHPRDAL